MAEYVTIHAFVRAPYDSYVHDETRFWNASGVSIKLGGTGVEVQMEVAEGAAARRHRVRDPGGGNPHSGHRREPCLPALCRPGYRECRLLHPEDPGDLLFPWFGQRAGAGLRGHVHGLKVGEVTDVRLTYDRAKDAVLAPVRFEVEPERVVGVGDRVFKTDAERSTRCSKEGCGRACRAPA